MHTALAQLAVLFQHYGLFAVFALLALENFGLPLPGELALLYAAYQIQVQGIFGLQTLLLTGIAACVLGQAAGYGLGRFSGAAAQRGLRLSGRHHAAVAGYFQRHGALTILFSRFVTGLRSLAGLAAGLFHMSWWTFMLCNLLGAVAWVSVMSGAGSLLGLTGPRLFRAAGRFDAVVTAAVLIFTAAAWYRFRRRRRGGLHESARLDRPVLSPIGANRADPDHGSHL